MKKEVPPFGVLSADYSPDTHVIIRSQDIQKAPGRHTEMPRGKTVPGQKGQSPMANQLEDDCYRATSFAKSNEGHQKNLLGVPQEQQMSNLGVHGQ